jgi:hypothetical protein
MGVPANRSGQYSHSAKACASPAEQDSATDATANNLHSDDQRAMHASFAFMPHHQGVVAKIGQLGGAVGFRSATLVLRSGKKSLALWISVIQPAAPTDRPGETTRRGSRLTPLPAESRKALAAFNPGMYESEPGSRAAACGGIERGLIERKVAMLATFLRTGAPDCLAQTLGSGVRLRLRAPIVDVDQIPTKNARDVRPAILQSRNEPSSNQGDRRCCFSRKASLSAIS